MGEYRQGDTVWKMSTFLHDELSRVAHEDAALTLIDSAGFLVEVAVDADVVRALKTSPIPNEAMTRVFENTLEALIKRFDFTDLDEVVPIFFVL